MMSGKKLIFILIGFLFSQNLFPLDYLFIEEASTSQYFIRLNVYRSSIVGNEIQASLSLPGEGTYSTVMDRGGHKIEFYAKSLENGFSIEAWAPSSPREYFTFTESDLQNGITRKSGTNFSVSEIEIFRKAEIDRFYPSMICTSNNENLSVDLGSDSDESIGEVSGVIRIDDFSQHTGFVNTFISPADITKDGKVSIGESHSVSFTNSHFRISSTSSLNDFYLLEPPPITISIQQPQCHGGKGSITIENIPPNETPRPIRLSIIQLYEDPSSDIIGDLSDYVELDDGTKLYYGAGSTQIIIIEPGENQYVFRPDNIDTEENSHLNLTSGWYRAEAFYLDGSTNQFCSFKTEPAYMAEPESVIINDIETVFFESPYHIQKHGEEAKIKSVKVENNQGNDVILWGKKTDGAFVEMDINSQMFGAGDYVFYVVDEEDCRSGEFDIEFKQPDPIQTLTGSTNYVEIVQPLCNTADVDAVNIGLSKGTLTIRQLNGGIPSFSYRTKKDENEYENWTVFTNQVNRSLEPGQYLIEIKDQGGVFYNDSYTVGASPLSIDELLPTRISCNGESDGQISIKASKGEGYEGTFSYWINEAQEKNTNKLDGYTFVNLDPGDYTIYFEDEDGCSNNTEQKQISQPASELAINIISQTIATCKDSDGSVTFSISGGWPNEYPYYVVLDGATEKDPLLISLGESLVNKSFEGLAAGVYTITVNSGFDEDDERLVCSSVPMGFRIDSANPLDDAAIVSLVKKESCTNKSDAIIQINGIDDIGNNYDLYFGSSSTDRLPITADIDNQFGGLTEGNYSLWIEEREGRQCVSINPITISIIDNPITIISAVESQRTSCETVSNGKIAITVEGGVGPNYQYSRDNFLTQQSESVISGLSAGTYSVYSKDAAGCIAEFSNVEVTTNENPVHWNQTTEVDASCDEASNGRIIINEGVSHSNNQALTYYKNNEPYIGDSENLADFFKSLSPGAYTVKIADDDGCYVENMVIIGSKNYLPQLNFNTNDSVACEGKYTGSVEITLIAHDLAVPVAELSLGLYDEADEFQAIDPNSGFLNIYDGLTNKAYTIKVRDGNNCANTLSYTPELLTEVLTLTEEWIPAPCPEADGIIRFEAAGGFSPESYDFFFTTVADTFSVGKGIESGEMTKPVLTTGRLKVVDSAGCIVEGEPDKSVLLRDNQVSIGEPIITHPTCIEAADGRITFELTRVVGAQYSFILTNKNDTDFEESGDLDLETNVIDGLLEGLYHLVVYENDGPCYAEYEGIELIDPEIISISDFTYNSIQYYGDATGEIAVDIEKGSKKYMLELINLDEQNEVYSGEVVEGLFEYDNLMAGNYKLRISDVQNCLYFSGEQWHEIPFEIKQPEAPLEIASTNLAHVTCFEYKDGRITVETTGGWDALYEYALEGNVSYGWQTLPVFDNLVAGSYIVKVRDAEGAIVEKSEEITQPELFEIEITHSKNASCPNYHNGELEVLSTNGVYEGNGLTYFVMNILSGAEISQNSGEKWRYNHLQKGEYEILVTDQNACFDNATFTIGEPDTVQITIEKNYIRVKHENTGVITITAIDGNGYYDYQWFVSGNETPIETGSTTGNLTFDSLVAGEYLIMLKDTANCIYEGNSEWMVRNIVMEEPELELSFLEKETPVTCNGFTDGEMQLTGVGGWGEYEFSFDGAPFSGDTTYVGLAAGFYNVVVKDSVGMTYERVVEINEPDVLTVNAISTLEHVRCFGGADGTIEMDINGGNPGYFVSIDEQEWQEGNVASDLPIGTYTVYVKDTKGCKNASGPFTLTQPDQIYISDSTVYKSTCQMNKGSIDASFEGGTGLLRYGWQRQIIDSEGVLEVVDLPELTTPSIEYLFAGQYIVTVTDSHECQSQFDFFVNDNTDLTITAIDTYPVTCYGYSDGSAKVHVEQGNLPYQHNWSGTGFEVLADSAWNFSAGNYVVSVTDDKGCYISQPFTIGTPDSLFYSIVNRIEPLCLGGEKGVMELTGLGGTMPYEFSWDNGSVGATLSNIDPGNYELTLADAHNCVSEFNFAFDFQRIVEPFVGNDTIICHYNSLVLDGGDYAAFSWQSSEGFTSGNRIVDINQAAVYHLVVTDSDNCIGFDTIEVEVSTLEISNLELEHVSCSGFEDGSAIVSINADKENYAISWPNGSSGYSSSGYSGGEYQVSAVNEFGCNDSRMFTINEPLPLSLRITFREPLCYGVDDGFVRPVADGGTEPYGYNWSHGVTSQQISNLSEGAYVLNVVDANDCLISEHFELPYVRTLLPDLGFDRAICQGNHLFLMPGYFSSYKWYLSNEEIGAERTLKATVPGEYSVVVTDDDGCVASDEVSIAMDTSDIMPSFLMATSVPLGDTLLVVDVTNPKPDNVSWRIDGEYEVAETNDYYSKIIFKQEGIFNVTLSAVSPSGCVADERKSVLVTAPGMLDENGARDIYYKNMKSLVVSPNPSRGTFTAVLELHESADVNFYLVRIDTGQIYETRKRNGLSTYSESFTHSGTGLFVLFAESGGERLMEKVLVY